MAPAARSIGSAPVAKVLTVSVCGSTRDTVCSSALSVHAAPAPTETLVGVSPTGNSATTRLVSGSMAAVRRAYVESVPEPEEAMLREIYEVFDPPAFSGAA